MKDKIFYRIVAVLIALGMAATIALIVYTYHLHSEVSVITFIANGG